LDLAELYYKNDLLDESINVYSRLTETQDNIKSTIGWKSRLEMAKIIIFETDESTSDQEQKLHSWLIEMAANTTPSFDNSDDLAEIYELLGYCSENGIGTIVDKKASENYYIACVEKGDDGVEAKQRSLCRLVDNYMEEEEEEKNYTAAFTYLEKVKPNLDQLSFHQARRMKYYLGMHRYIFIFMLFDTLFLHLLNL
jgi:TPR repeat protein